MITVNELFSGIGAQRAALERAGIPHEIVGISEIDKYAIKSYEAMYGEVRNYGDISKVDKLDYADLWTYSFPCTDISSAGQQKGIIKGETRSGLLYEVQRLLEAAYSDDSLPRYLMLENVKNLVGERFKPQFDEWLSWLDSIGYNTYWKVLDAKDFGVPQHRERVFAISIRNDIDDGTFAFPAGFDSPVRLKDVLEEKVDEKYYLPDSIVSKMEPTHRQLTDGEINVVGTLDRWSCERSNRVHDPNGISPTLTTITGSGQEIKIVDPLCCASRGRYTSVNGTRGTRQRLEIRKDGLSNALTTVQKDSYVLGSFGAVGELRVRKYTPLECWRLMGFADEAFHKAEAVCSNAQLCKQAGNSIVVDVLVEMFRNLFRDELGSRRNVPQAYSYDAKGSEAKNESVPRCF